MKVLFFLGFLLLFANCKNLETNKLVAKKAVITDTVSTKVIETKTDTLTKTSKPFKLNNIVCYWKHTFILYDEIGSEITMELKDYKTNTLLLVYEHQPKYPEDYDYTSGDYFEKLNKEHFTDVNFDGFKDFIIYSYGSMPMTSLTNIYIFNSQTKTFSRDIYGQDQDLSDTNIEEIDSINKILVTSSFDMERVYKRKHYFGKAGKIIATEYISEEDFYPNDTTQKIIKTYKKIINGKVVETRIDTIKEE